MDDDKRNTKLAESEQLIARMVSRFAEHGVLSEVVSTKTFFGELKQENITLFVEAIRWLRAEDLVRTSAMLEIIGEPTDIEVRIVLTANGFALLGRRLGSGESVGAAVKNASAGHGYANAGELIGGILGAFTKSVSS
jgi:hypothetical protein